MQWISAKDQDVPREGTFLLFYYGGMAVGEYLCDEQCPNFICGSDVIWNVTHWMKLPDAPKE